jgi:hypothetical protein
MPAADPASPLTPAHAPPIALVPPLDVERAASVFTAARVRRQLSIEEAARRSALTPDQVRWLEGGRVYAFRTPDDALAAAVLLASALEIDNHEARELAGMPVLPRSLQVNPRGRIALIVIVAAIVVVGAMVLGYTAADSQKTPAAAGVVDDPSLPPVWKIPVQIVNGGGDQVYTHQVADRVAAIGYNVVGIEPAARFVQRRTTVFYGPGARDQEKADALAQRLCGIEVLPLPGGGKAGTIYVAVGRRPLVEPTC